MKNTESQLLQDVSLLRDEQLTWTRDLIALPTVNPYSGDASAGSEAAGQDWVEQVMRQLGGQVRRVPVPKDVYQRGGLIGPANRRWDGRENVVATWTLGDGKGPTVLLNDHMDTVGTHGMAIAPFDPVIKDGLLYGRGSTDTKGNLVLGLIALKALLGRARGLHGRVIFESVVDEECDGAGAGTLACCLAGIRGDVAICLDGSVGQVGCGCNGIATARLMVRGRSGHNAQGGSINAIDKAILVKQAIDRFAQAHLQQYPTCRTNLGIFRAGTLPSIVPGEAELQVNLCYPPEDAAEAERATGHWGGGTFRARFAEAIRRDTAGDPWLAEHPPEVSWIKDPYPFQCDPSHPLLALASRTAEEVHGQPTPVGMNPAWLDASHLSRQLQAPTLGLGHGTPGCAHGPVEHVRVNDLWHGAQVVALLLSRLLSRA